MPQQRQPEEWLDQEVMDAICAEQNRQADGIELIASENYVSRGVLRAMGSVLTNKYAEGYPGKRYYGGCEHVDTVEQLAIDRAKQLFGAEHVNVQPHSGAQANAAAYLAVLEPGDRVLALKLDHGGHLTHGFHLNSSGHFYQFEHYGVNTETEVLDYEEVMDAALKFRPKLLVAGASAYPRHFDFKALRRIADATGSLLMMDMAHVAGLVATGLHPDPVPWCDIVTTTTHKTLRAARGGMILCRKAHARAMDRSVFPGQQGGPLMHMIAGKAVGLGEALQPEFRTYQEQTVANAAYLGESLREQGLRLVSRGHGQPSVAGGFGQPEPRRRDGQVGGDGHGQRRPALQQEHDPLRSPARTGHQRYQAGFAGCHHPRHGRAGVQADRRVDWRNCPRSGRHGPPAAHQERSSGDGWELPRAGLNGTQPWTLP